MGDSDKPKFVFPSIQLPTMPKMDLPSLNTNLANRAMTEMFRNQAEEKRSNAAVGFAERLNKLIAQFDAELDQTQQVGVRLVSFGQTVTFALSGEVGYWNPALVIFNGYREDGAPVQLVQHMSQISVLLIAMPRPNPDEPKTPFDFHKSATESTNNQPDEVGSDSITSDKI